MANIITAHFKPIMSQQVGWESAAAHGERTAVIQGRSWVCSAPTFWECLTFNSAGNRVRRSFCSPINNT